MATLNNEKGSIPVLPSANFTNGYTTNGKTPKSCKLQIVIVGAGIGGLSTAIALAQKGHSVTVLEAAAHLAEVGAGIQVPPNSSRILRSWGLEADLRAKSVEPERLLLRRWKDGNIIGQTKFYPEFQQKYHAPYFVIHRAHLHDALHQHAVAAGAEIRVASRVVEYDMDTPSVTLANGEAIGADLIVAADGFRSMGRKALFPGEEDAAQRTGLAAYRAMIDVESIKNDPITSWIASSPNLHLWMGNMRHAMTYLITGGSSFNMVLSHPDTTDPSTWQNENILEEMKAQYKGWDPTLTTLLSMVKKTAKWPLFEVKPLPKWVSDSGRFLILGDAAHAMVPYLALEDAAALAECVEHINTANDLSKVLSIFEKVRISRTNAVHHHSSLNGHVLHYPDGPEQMERDKQMRPEVEEKPFESSPNKWSDPVTQRWCYSYDAVAEVNHALQILQ